MKAAVLILSLAACSACSVPYTAPLIRAELPSDKAAVTVCAENNVPYVAIDSGSQGTVMDIGFQVHEAKHVTDAMKYRGGCKPFVRRYNSDSAFRVKVEWAAYCVQGHWLIDHGLNPEWVWSYISGSMRQRYGASTTRNCLYEDWRK